MRLRVLGLSVGGALAVAALACREPTQVTFEIRTDVPCPSVRRTSLVVGAPGETESRPEPTTVTSFCEGGFIGSLVTVPASGSSAKLAIRVVTGVERDASECSPENGYKGCIVQRRRLGYLAHTPLFVPIEMRASCKDLPCDPLSTCNRFRQCVPADVDPNACTQPAGCAVKGDEPDPGGKDGGASDATLGSDVGTRDATSDAEDASTIGDGALPDGAVNARTPGGVACGGQAPPICSGSKPSCCMESTGNGLLCTAGPCVNQVRIYHCDGREDCTGGAYCCESSIGSDCIPSSQSCGTGSFLCHDDTDCKGQTRCVAAPAPLPYGRCM